MIDLTLRIMSKPSLPGTGPYMISTLSETLLNIKSIFNNTVEAMTRKLRRKQSHINIIRRFYDHLDGKGENPVTPEEGLHVTRTIDDIKDIICESI